MQIGICYFESACRAYFLKDGHGTQCQMNGKASLKATATGWTAALAPELLSGVSPEAGDQLARETARGSSPGPAS